MSAFGAALPLLLFLARSVQVKANCDWRFEYALTVQACPDGLDKGACAPPAVIKAPQIVKADPGVIVNWGCGHDNQKCTCDASVDHTELEASLNMKGVGTCGTWTGLEFSCSFTVRFFDGQACACQLHVNIPFGSKSNSFAKCDNCLDGFRYKIPLRGHDFTGSKDVVHEKKGNRFMSIVGPISLENGMVHSGGELDAPLKGEDEKDEGKKEKEGGETGDALQPQLWGKLRKTWCKIAGFVPMGKHKRVDRLANQSFNSAAYGLKQCQLACQARAEDGCKSISYSPSIGGGDCLLYAEEVKLPARYITNRDYHTYFQTGGSCPPLQGDVTELIV